MFFTIIGVGVFVYGLIHTLLVCISDCDLQLAFYEKFGKPIGHLKGKVVFITGASSGIGEHTAIALAKRGVKLVLAARRRDELERVKRVCIEASKGLLTDKDVLVIQMDVTDVDSHQKHFDHAVEHFGTVDVLFNNAGRSQRALWENIDLKVDKDMFDLNLFSNVNLSRVAVRFFNTRGEGHVGVVSSVTGIIGFPLSATYTGSKHALHGYYEALRAEKIKKGISVSIFCPGPTFSNFLQNSFTEKPGEQYGVATKTTDRRMSTERCGELIAIGLANKVDEAWMGLYPMMPFAYMVVYFPQIYKFLLRTFGPDKVFSFRDSKEDPALEASKGLLSEQDVLVLPMDVIDLSSHKRHFDYAVRHFGTVDVLLNNAGRSQRALWENIDIAVDKQMFELNIFATVNLSRVAVNYFNGKGHGQVGAVSSIAGIVGVPFSATYTGSKHALHGYFEALRAEKIGRSITVSLFCPGPVYTNFLQNSFTGKSGENYGISAQPTDRRMTGERCGELIAVGLANKVDEGWMGLFPTIPFAYMAVYFPLVYKFILKTVGPERLFKLRDGKPPVLTEEKGK